jgi:[phosphatase 2A protein]-leucine-carboxy methyltransferase
VVAEQGGTSLVSSSYALIPGDLRYFEDMQARLKDLLDPEIPTLVIAECVFIYLDPKHSDKILQWFANEYSTAGLACMLYDPVGLNDKFGKVMINNLQVSF